MERETGMCGNFCISFCVGECGHVLFCMGIGEPSVVSEEEWEEKKVEHPC